MGHIKTEIGCYSWVILAACTGLQFVADGIYKSFGLFNVKLLEEFNETVSLTTLIMGIMNGVYCITAFPVMMYLIKTIQPRTVIMIGSIMIATGCSLSCLTPNIYFLFFTLSFLVGKLTGCSLSCLAPNIYFLFFTLSFLVGAGVSFIYPPFVFILGTYFTERRATANAIAKSGGCLAALVAPLVYQYILDTYGLRGAFLLTGAIQLHCFPLAIFLRAPVADSRFNTTKVKNEKNKDEFNAKEGVTLLNTESDDNIQFREVDYIYRRELNVSDFADRNKCQKQLIIQDCALKTRSDLCLNEPYSIQQTISLPNIFQYDNISICSNLPISTLDTYNEHQNTKEDISTLKSIYKIFKNPSFVVYLFGNTFATMVGMTFLSFLPLHAKQHDISNDKIVVLVSLTGVVDLFGRLLCGCLVDKAHIRPSHVIAFSQVICGVAYISNQLLTSFPGLIVLCVLIGLFNGTWIPLFHSLIVESVGVDLYPNALPIVLMVQFPMYIIGPYSFGLLRDVTGTFVVSFHVIGCLAILSAVFYVCGSFVNNYICTKDS